MARRTRHGLQMTTNEVNIKLGIEGQAQVLQALDKIQGGFSSLEHKLIGVAVALAAFTGLSKITESIHSVVELGASLIKLSAQTGASIPFLVTLRKAIGEAGGDANE